MGRCGCREGRGAKIRKGSRDLGVCAVEGAGERHGEISGGRLLRGRVRRGRRS